MKVDQIQFRRLLGHFATGVAVVTAADVSGERAGVTINSFNSVSLTPELILFSLDRSLLSLPLFEQAGHYAVSFLAADQKDISGRFARRGEDKWSKTPIISGRHGGLLIDGALVHIECARHTVIDGGDHRIFLCNVLELHEGAGTDPLIYFRGAYHEIAPAGSASN